MNVSPSTASSLLSIHQGIFAYLPQATDSDTASAERGNPHSELAPMPPRFPTSCNSTNLSSDRSRNLSYFLMPGFKNAHEFIAFLRVSTEEGHILSQTPYESLHSCCRTESGSYQPPGSILSYYESTTMLGGV